MRGNLPVAVASTWISNPFTYLPLYFFCYEIGAWFLGVPVDSSGNPIQIRFDLILSDLELFFHQLGNLGWKALGSLLLGCFIVGSLTAIGFFILIRVLWRLHIYRAWNHRREKRLKRKHQ